MTTLNIILSRPPQKHIVLIYILVYTSVASVHVFWLSYLWWLTKQKACTQTSMEPKQREKLISN